MKGEGESWEEALMNADKKHKHEDSKCIHKAEFPKGRHLGQGFCLDCMLVTCVNFDFSNGGKGNG